MATKESDKDEPRAAKSRPYFLSVLKSCQLFNPLPNWLLVMWRLLKSLILPLSFLLSTPGYAQLLSPPGPYFKSTDQPELSCHTPACLHLQQLEQPSQPFQPATQLAGCQPLYWRQASPHPADPSIQCYQQRQPLTLLNDPQYKGLAQETRNIGLLSVGVMLAIFALPEDISNWDRSEMKPGMLGDKWIENNKEGPVWDKDEWEINYIGHPYFGAVYYVVARNQGFGPLGSFTYSFLMSAFLWELGIEALAEIPSKQDLVITPVIGSIVGEAFYIWEQRIIENDGKLWGSYGLGSSVRFLVNPAGSLSAAINRSLDSQDFIKEAQTHWVARSSDLDANRPQMSGHSWVGIEMELKF